LIAAGGNMRRNDGEYSAEIERKIRMFQYWCEQFNLIVQVKYNSNGAVQFFKLYRRVYGNMVSHVSYLGESATLRGIIKRAEQASNATYKGAK
jgi:hypothetical protein